MITLQDIAKPLGLSTATVSRILNGSINHNDQTRAKVLELAAKLGYQARHPARSHGVHETKQLLGVFLESATGDAARTPVVSIRMLQGISNAARAAGLALNVDYVSGEDAHGAAASRIAGQLDHQDKLLGTLFVGQSFDADLVSQVAKVLPTVRLNAFSSQLSVDCVGQNDIEAVDQLLEHFLALGHRKIGFLSEPLQSWPVQARLGGYFLGLTHRGIPYQPEWVIHSASPCYQPGWEEALAKVTAAIRSGVRAWIVNHDDVGYMLTYHLRQHDLLVPRDVSIAGFDNLNAMDPTLPKLTTIEWPFESLGEESVRRILTRQKSPLCPPLQVAFRGRLLTGASTQALSSPSKARGKKS